MVLYNRYFQKTYVPLLNETNYDAMGAGYENFFGKSDSAVQICAMSLSCSGVKNHRKIPV